MEVVAVILKPCSGFPGVDYNEKKVNQGKAEFISSSGFICAEKAQDYKSELKAFASINPNIKNQQFHAILSTKGKNYAKEELDKIAREWLEKMGYKDQPYLLYFHRDTENNHVHIVSCRIDINGHAIDAAWEGKRAVKAINEIIGQDYKFVAQSDIRDILENYQFSTISQGKLLLEKKGWIVTENEKINLIRNGTVQASLDVQIIKNKVSKREVDEKRKEQLSAIVRQYKKGLEFSEVQPLLKEKFGIDIILHTSGDHKNPYGYTLIDNANKAVYRGREILPLKELLKGVDRSDKIREAEQVISLHSSDTIGFFQFRKNLYALGYKLNYKGEVGVKGDKTILFKLEKSLLEKLYYNERLSEAKMFSYRTVQERSILAQIYRIKLNDLPAASFADMKRKNANDYKELLYSINGRLNINTSLKDRGVSLFYKENDTFLIDKEEKIIVDVSEFDKARAEAMSFDDFIHESTTNFSGNLRGFSYINNISSLLQMEENEQIDSASEPKKNRRKK